MFKLSEMNLLNQLVNTGLLVRLILCRLGLPCIFTSFTSFLPISPICHPPPYPLHTVGIPIFSHNYVKCGEDEAGTYFRKQYEVQQSKEVIRIPFPQSLLIIITLFLLYHSLSTQPMFHPHLFLYRCSESGPDPGGPGVGDSHCQEQAGAQQGTPHLSGDTWCWKLTPPTLVSGNLAPLARQCTVIAHDTKLHTSCEEKV